MFLFPLSLACAVIKIDLFEVDAMQTARHQRISAHPGSGSNICVLVVGLGFVLQTASLAYSPAVPLVFGFLMIVIFTPMRDRIQRAVDRLHGRTSYNVQKTLEKVSGALLGTLSLDEIYTLTVNTICEALLIMERIFDAWFTTKESGKGTGLDLLIARDVMTECFGGRIEVESTPGVGSFSTLWRPRRQPTVANQPEEKPAVAATFVM